MQNLLCVVVLKIESYTINSYPYTDSLYVLNAITNAFSDETGSLRPKAYKKPTNCTFCEAYVDELDTTIPKKKKKDEAAVLSNIYEYLNNYRKFLANPTAAPMIDFNLFIIARLDVRRYLERGRFPSPATVQRALNVTACDDSDETEDADTIDTYSDIHGEDEECGNTDEENDHEEEDLFGDVTVKLRINVKNNTIDRTHNTFVLHRFKTETDSFCNSAH